MAYNFQVQSMVRVSALVTDIHTVEVTLYHSSEYAVKSEYRIFRTPDCGDGKAGYTHKETLSDEIYESLFEAEQAYHVLCIKGFTRINVIDKNSDETGLRAKEIEGLPF